MKVKKTLCLILAVLMVSGVALAAASCKKETKTLICGVTDFDPMNYLDKDGEWTGFDTEFARLVADKLGMDIEFQEIVWGNKFLELNSGAITCIWNGFTANAHESDGTPRGQLADMTYGYMLNQQCVVVKADRAGEFTSTDALSGKTIAAEEGSAGAEAAREFAGSGTVIGTSNQIATYMEIMSGAVDCAVVDILLAKNTIGTGDYAGLVIANIELESEIYAIGFKKGSDLTAKVNKAMQELFDDGTLEALAKKYGLENTLFLDKDTKF